MNKRKSSGFPLCGVAVNNKKCRARSRNISPSVKRLVFLTSLPNRCADILCASSTITRSQSDASSLVRRSSLRDT